MIEVEVVMKEFDNGDMRMMMIVSRRVSRWCERFEMRVNRVMWQMGIKLMVVVVEVFVVDSVGRIRV